MIFLLVFGGFATDLFFLACGSSSFNIAQTMHLPCEGRRRDPDARPRSITFTPEAATSYTAWAAVGMVLIRPKASRNR